MSVKLLVAPGEVTSLKHELRDNPVENGALVVQGLARLANALLLFSDPATSAATRMQENNIPGMKRVSQQQTMLKLLQCRACLTCQYTFANSYTIKQAVASSSGEANPSDTKACMACKRPLSCAENGILVQYGINEHQT
eukprot:GHRR01028436.1.p1 GENE.GHRR01028436.1~~GHRR01028436.1.p1  ORF type:complete len:139 (+),score=34.87 GHRR01028436.1:81-497(+)